MPIQPFRHRESSHSNQIQAIPEGNLGVGSLYYYNAHCSDCPFQNVYLRYSRPLCKTQGLRIPRLFFPQAASQGTSLLQAYRFVCVLNNFTCTVHRHLMAEFAPCPQFFF